MSEGPAVAADLPELMGRMTLRRAHYLRAHDYVRLMLLGFGLFVAISIVNPPLPPLIMLLLSLLFIPFLLNLYRLARTNLEKEFLRDTMAYYLQAHPGWSYNLHGEGFPFMAFRAASEPESSFEVRHLLKGTLGASNLRAVMADVRITRGKKKMFPGSDPHLTGWVIGLECDLDAISFSGLEAVSFSKGAGWSWFFTPASWPRYSELSLQTSLNEPAPYEKVRCELAGMFAFLEKISLKLPTNA